MTAHTVPLTAGTARTNRDVSRHGGFVHEELVDLGLAPDEVIDFSVNVNPYGPCSEVRRAIAQARIERYPDPSATRARQAIGGWLGVSHESVIVGSGAVDILWVSARALLSPGDGILIAEPAFSEMRHAAEQVRARVIEHRSHPEDDFAFDADAFALALARERPRAAYLATPANPSGTLTSLGTILGLAEEHPKTQFIVDLSFLSLSDSPEDDVSRTDSRVLWVRSLTKELSVPGLRVGFAVGPPSLVARLERNRPPWTVSAPAEAVALVATTEAVRRFVDESRAKLLGQRDEMTLALRDLGIRPHPSRATYVLADLGSHASDGAHLRRALLARHGILIRDATSFGLPHHVRIAARPAPDQARLIHALGKELTR
jgi:histidinol-phosphate/aromatic aminotransferase/cobyric acid decarboxylase-like protein